MQKLSLGEVALGCLEVRFLANSICAPYLGALPTCTYGYNSTECERRQEEIGLGEELLMAQSLVLNDEYRAQ